MKRMIVLGNPNYQQELSAWKEERRKRYMAINNVLYWHYDVALIYLQENGITPTLGRRDKTLYFEPTEFNPDRVVVEVDYGIISKISMG